MIPSPCAAPVQLMCPSGTVRVSHRAFLITIQARLVDDSHATSLSAEISVAPAPAAAPVGSFWFLGTLTHRWERGEMGGRGSSTCVLVRGETFHFRFALGKSALQFGNNWIF